MPSRSEEFRAVRDKTPEQLLGPLEPPVLNSGLTESVHRLWRTPVKRFSLGDLRLLIGQQLALEYLVPIALTHLQEHPLAEGTYYPGDLLKMVATVPESYWDRRPDLRPTIVTALERALARIHRKNVPPDLADDLQAVLVRLRRAFNQPPA